MIHDTPSSPYLMNCIAMISSYTHYKLFMPLFTPPFGTTRRRCPSFTGTNSKVNVSRSNPSGTMQSTAASAHPKRSSTTPSVPSSASGRASSIPCVARRRTLLPVASVMKMGTSTVTREINAWRGWRRGRLGVDTRISRGRTLGQLALWHRKR